jgi:hypothetical protein
MARILATLAAALVVALALVQSPAHAQTPTEPPAVGQPLKLTPTFRQARQVEHPVAARTAHRPAQLVGHRTTQVVGHRTAHPMARPVAHPAVARRAPAGVPAAVAATAAPEADAPAAVAPVAAPVAASATAAAPAAVESRGPEELAGTLGLDKRAAARSRDSSGLIAMLPWWRSDPMETIRYLDRETGSGVLAAADAWLFPPPVAESHYGGTGIAILRTATDEASELEAEAEINVTEAGELNSIDLLAVAVAGPRMPSEPWLQAWLAMLAGALAAAATARFLFS